MANIRDILDTLGIPSVGAEHRHGRVGWIQIDCPWCGHGLGKYHLGISLSTHIATCWRCGKHDLVETLAEITGKSTHVVRGLLQGVVREAPPVRTAGRLRVPAGVASLLPGHRTYLIRRGFAPDEIVRLWGVLGIGAAARLAWRLYIPITLHGEVVSWITRSINPHSRLRWVSAAANEESVLRRELLYGADYARHAIIIHEGPTDVWATGPGAVATCGVGYTMAQVRLMAAYPVRVVCFDSEPVAQQRARGLASALSPYPGVTHSVVLETGKDPAEADLAEIAELRKKYLE